MPCWSRFRLRRRMGRCSISSNRKCTWRQTCVVRYFPSIRCTDWVVHSKCFIFLSKLLFRSWRLSRMGLAYSVHLFNCVGYGGLMGAFNFARKPRIPRSWATRQNAKSPCFCGLPSSFKTVNSWYIHYDGNLRVVLYYDGVRTSVFSLASKTLWSRTRNGFRHCT